MLGETSHVKCRANQRALPLVKNGYNLFLWRPPILQPQGQCKSWLGFAAPRPKLRGKLIFAFSQVKAPKLMWNVRGQHLWKGKRNGLNETGNLSHCPPSPLALCSTAFPFCTICFFHYLWKEMRERRKCESNSTATECLEEANRWGSPQPQFP